MGVFIDEYDFVYSLGVLHCGKVALDMNVNQGSKSHMSVRGCTHQAEGGTLP